MDITPADVLAAVDVLQQVVEESDDCEFERAVELRNACRELIAHTRATISMLESEMLRQVEAAPRTFGDVTFIAVNDNVQRFDHDAIEAGVIVKAVDLAVDRETGEIDPKEAARQAAYLMKSTYVSPSTVAKKSALERHLGLDVDSVVSKESRGRKLLEVEAE